MNNNSIILFDKIPKEFKKHEKVSVLQYEISGIQGFIFGGVTISSTRRIIAKRSEYIVHITDVMEEWLRENLSRFSRFRVLSKSSGKLICAVSHRVKQDKLYDLSNQLQRIIYASTDGKLEMFYGICDAVVVEGSEWNQNQNAMSVLAEEVNRNKYHCINLLGFDHKKYRLDEYMLNASVTTEDDEVIKSNNIMVAVKFDLDNLGSFFLKLNAFDTRKAASERLAEILNEALEEDAGIYPIFVGGDDIFAIADIDNYLKVVSDLHERIKEKIGASDELLLYKDYFGISGGASFIRNDLGTVPLVYYFEQSEDSLMRAKDLPDKNSFVVSNYVLTWEQLKTLSNILSKNGAIITQGLGEQQIYNLYLNIKELKSRILRLNKNTGKTLLTSKEEEDVYSIN